MLIHKRKLKGRLIKAFSLSICLCIIAIFSCVLQASAAEKKSESVQSFFFTSPRGQTASVRARATVKEKYTTSGSKSTFNYRDCFLSYNRAYTSSIPSVTSGKGVHKTSATGTTLKTFSPWIKGSYLWDTSVYPNGGGSYNQTLVSYSRSTSNVSGYIYTVYCSGTLVPTQVGNVYVSLNTN